MTFLSQLRKDYEIDNPVENLENIVDFPAPLTQFPKGQQKSICSLYHQRRFAFPYNQLISNLY